MKAMGIKEGMAQDRCAGGIFLWVQLVLAWTLDIPCVLGSKYIFILFIYLFKQLVSRHNVNHTKYSYRRIAGCRHG